MSSIDPKDFPAIPFPTSYAADFRVYFDPKVYLQINEHVKADTSHEVGGILVGLWQKDENGPYVSVTAMIRCDKAVGKEGEVTFTHETWNDIACEMDGPYVDFKIVGWYHSHPGFGVFLSERDLFIQEHFFSNAGQIALVIDPISKTEGVFLWKGDKIAASDYFWVGQKINLSREDDADAHQHPKAKLTDQVGMHCGGTSSKAEPSLLDNSWFSVLVLVTLCMLMFVLGGFLKPTGEPSYEQRLLEGAVLDYCFVSGKRPGLDRALVKISQDLHQAMVEVEKLQKGEVVTEKDGDGKEKKQSVEPVDPKRLAMLVGYLRRSHSEIQESLALYCLSEKEKLAVLKKIEMNLHVALKQQQDQQLQEKSPKDKQAGKKTDSKKPTEKTPTKKGNRSRKTEKTRRSRN